MILIEIKETKRSLFERLKTTILENEDVCNEAMSGETYSVVDSFVDTDNDDINVSLVTHVGGEGQGSKYYSVLKFTAGAETEYIKFYGYYQSYCGVEYDDWRRVKRQDAVTQVWQHKEPTTDAGRALKSLITDDIAERFMFEDTYELEDVFGNIYFQLVDSYGGEEQGEEYWTVFEFIHGSEHMYVKFEGTYASHYGADFSDWYFVKGVQAPIIEWVAVL